MNTNYLLLTQAEAQALRERGTVHALRGEVLYLVKLCGKESAVPQTNLRHVGYAFVKDEPLKHALAAEGEEAVFRLSSTACDRFTVWPSPCGRKVWVSLPGGAVVFAAERDRLRELIAALEPFSTEE